MARNKRDPGSALRDMFETSPRKAPDQAKPKRTKKKPVAKRGVGQPHLGDTFLTVDDVARRYRVSHATVWRWVQMDPAFPEPIRLSGGTTRWEENQLRDFERVAKSRRGTRAGSASQTAVKNLKKGAS